MNRAEIRRLQRETQKKAATYNMNMAEIQQMKADTTIEVVRMLLPLIAQALHDDCGFGPMRINRMIQNLTKKADCCINGYVSVKEIKEWAINYGIEL